MRSRASGSPHLIPGSGMYVALAEAFHRIEDMLRERGVVLAIDQRGVTDHNHVLVDKRRGIPNLLFILKEQIKSFYKLKVQLLQTNILFFKNDNVVSLTKSLLGKALVTKFKGQKTSGIITETEAYNGEVDRATHAFGGRRTERTEIMYAEGGIAYVYLC